MSTRSILLACLLLPLAVACGDDDDQATADAADVVADADPNQPDAEPAVPDADTAQPDADETPQADANTGVAEEVVCGDTTCESPQVCCTTYAGGLTQTCTAADDCTQGAALACDGAEDCTEAGEVCCATGGQMNASTSCAAGATCERLVCRGLDECDADNGETCCDLTIGISVCSTICF